MLLKNKDKLYISEIKGLLGTSKQNMTNIIDKLVENGLVKRSPDMNDRRMFYVIITTKGNEYLIKWQQNKIKEIQTIFNYFSDEDLESLYKSIENIKFILIKNKN